MTSPLNYSNTTQTEGTTYDVMSPHSRLISKAAALSNDHELNLTPLSKI